MAMAPKSSGASLVVREYCRMVRRSADYTYGSGLVAGKAQHNGA